MLHITTTEITLDLVPKSGGAKVKASQYDNETRMIVCNIEYNGEPYDLTNIGGVRVEGTRTDGVAFASECAVSESQAIFLITNEMTGCAGKHPAEIILTGSDGERLGTMNFSIVVEKAAMDEDAVVTPEDATVLQQYIDSIKSAVVENADGGTFNWG